MPISQPPPQQYGASCLPDFAGYLHINPTQQHTIDAAAKLNNQYVLVHMYLVPGEENDPNRMILRGGIESEFAELHAIRLHDWAYAIPTSRGSERITAEEVWDHLIYAGAQNPSNALDAWFTGDVIYVHYVGQDGICVLAATPRTGERLPDARER